MKNLNVLISLTLIVCTTIFMFLPSGLLIIQRGEDVHQGIKFLNVISMSFLVISIGYGGRGVKTVNRLQWSDNWNIDSAKGIFNKQAIFLILAIILFVISLIRTVF